MIEITFLGTSAGLPTPTRNVSALAIQPSGSKDWMLFDCGEGTQHRLMETSLSPYHLSKIFITHLHGDHVYGLFGLLASRGMSRAQKPLALYGPAGLKKMVDTVMSLSQLNLPFGLDIREVEAGDRLTFEEVAVDVVALSHSITSYGYALTFPDRPGRFDVAKAKALGIPEGPLYARLKRGERVRLADGRVIDGRALVGPPIEGKKIAIGGDNDNPLLFSPYAPFDLMVHEATYTQLDFDNLERKFKHTTARMLGIAAEKMGVKSLIFTHISPRYDKKGVEALKKEIESFYDGEVIAAEDLMVLEVLTRQVFPNRRRDFSPVMQG